MYAQFTDEARKTMALALREARGRHQELVKTEHILLALLDQNGAAMGILSSLGVDCQRIRFEMDSDKPGNSETASAKAALEFAIEEARGLSHEAVDTGHLLLGLARDPEGLAGCILRDQGVSPDLVRQKLTEGDSAL